MSGKPSEEVLILSAARTAIGNLNGGLSSLPAHELGSVVIEESLRRARVKPDQVSEVLMGQILTAGKYAGAGVGSYSKHLTHYFKSDCYANFYSC